MKFGNVTLNKIVSSADLRRLLPAEITGSEIVIVKPNWFSPHPANFTDAEALGILLDTLDGHAIVVEAYTLEKHDGTMSFTVDGEEVDWRWLMDHPDWGWVSEEGRWDEIRRQDRWFMDEYGLTDVLTDHGAEYVNVTEEVWQGRIADPASVKEAVEERFEPIQEERLYDNFPEALHAHRGAPFISYGKIKGIGGSYPSLTVKNLFGLIPDPLRSWWHGPDDKRLGRSIVDIMKIYAAHFRLHGVCEAMKEVTVSHPEGEVKVPWGSYNIVRDLGIVASGPDLVSLDAVISGLIGIDPAKVNYITLGEEILGPYKKYQVERAITASKEWFPVK